MRTASITLAMVLAGSAHAAMITNASWETGDNTGWTQIHGGFVTSNAPGCAANAPGESDGYVWGQTGAFSMANGSDQQSVVPPVSALAEYEVNAGVWLTLFDTGGTASSISADLLIDGVVKDSAGLSGSAIDVPWTWIDLSYTGSVAAEATIRITLELDALSGTSITVGDLPAPWAWVWADGAQVVILPEPITIFTLLGAVPLLHRKR